METPEVTATLLDADEQPSFALSLAGLSPSEKKAIERYQEQQDGPLTQAQAPNAFVSDYETIQAFALAGALAPPEDPRQVANVYRRSSALRPCVEAVCTNTVGFGYSFEPVIDLEHAGAKDKIREAIIQDRIATGSDAEPTDEDVEETRRLIERESLRERFKLERFFSHVCPTRSFNLLRWESRVEVEGGGNAYWEVTRREDGSIATMDRVEAHTMRLRRTEERYLKIEVNQRRSPLAYEKATVPLRFRTYCQLVLGGAKAVYFKQYGDPRTLSSRTGRWYANRALLELAEGDTPPATEIIHWRVFDLIGPYGVPRWYGAQYAVMGLLASERINYDYFDNKAIPPFAIFVSGGKLASNAHDKIKELLKSIKGQASFWKILVLEAESSNPNAKTRIEIHPLLKDQPQDALFQVYEANGAKKIQQQWRLPDLLVGRSEESNKAQAEAALQMSEQQVFQPLREEEDDFFNRFVLPEMGIRFWMFKTNSAVARDPALQTELAVKWGTTGALRVNEMRALASDVFNKDLPPIEDGYGNLPSPLTLAAISGEKSAKIAGIIPGSVDGVEQPVTADDEKAATDLAQHLVATRDALRAKADGGASMADAIERARQATRVLRVSQKDWDTLWEK